MKAKTRTLFSVVEVINEDGRHCEVNWHPDISAILDEVSPNYAVTDKLIDMAEELLEAEADLTAESDDGQQPPEKT